jgi:hypothetical protein
MPFARQPAAEQATPREKHLILLVIGLVVLVVAGAALWGTLRPGTYGSSKDGCITVSLPSSMGAGLIHQCGSGALATCKHAYASTDAAARLTRPQCRLAGITPAKAASAPPG